MQRVIEILSRKRDRGVLADEEIGFVVDGFTRGLIPDYQVAALLMAIQLNGMSDEETAALTARMVASGATLDFSEIGRPVADRHSTGGVGDKTTILTLPLAAAAGLVVPMISGRSLGHTGGTLDKLESIQGFRTDFTLDEFRELVVRHGVAISAQTAEIAPADRALYALRDATATVPSIPLIASSIVSKKLAEGLDALVLDVKAGSGAFMKTEAEARRLASVMTSVATRQGTPCQAILTRMDQPLGRAVGNGLEVAEAIAALKGEGPDDLVALAVEITAHMVALGMTKLGFTPDVAAARRAVRDLLDSGVALERFRRLVADQGGDPNVVDDPLRLPRAGVEMMALSPRSGFVETIDAESLGWAVVELGGGRTALDDEIDRGVGLLVEARIGDDVRTGDPVCRVLGRDAASVARACERVAAAYTVGDRPVPVPPLVLGTVGG
jgi:pyrimidine-nucleoside phosphorylase/thymidine phosphorylase